MYVADNYGARWVKGMMNWVRIKTLSGGYPYPMLLREGLMECGLKKGKMIDLINEFSELGFIDVQKDGMVFWVDENIKPISNTKGITENITEKMKPYLDAKKKIVKEEPKSENDILKDIQHSKYELYMRNCVDSREEPLKFDAWITVNKGEV